MTTTMAMPASPPAGRLGKCERCGDLCKVAAEKNPAAEMLRLAEEPKGYCVNCAVAEWFWVSRSRAMVPEPDSLLWKPVQDQFAKIMVTARADAKPEEIDWKRVVANWNLPFRVGKRNVDPVANPLPPRVRTKRGR